jgi:threonine/homoserine/homoserine lactone efflux protein
VAAVLTLTPGAATALVVRSAALGGRRAALRTTVGNSLGVLAWAVLAALGVAAVVAASTEAFAAVKLAGAVFLILLGAQTVVRGRGEADRSDGPHMSSMSAFRDGLLTSVLNPKLAVFFVALFPQFVPDRVSVLPSALLMAAMIVAFDLAWYSTLAYLVARAKRAFVEGPWLRRAERLTGGVLIGLGARLALERR